MIASAVRAVRTRLGRRSSDADPDGGGMGASPDSSSGLERAAEQISAKELPAVIAQMITDCGSLPGHWPLVPTGMSTAAHTQDTKPHW